MDGWGRAGERRTALLKCGRVVLSPPDSLRAEEARVLPREPFQVRREGSRGYFLLHLGCYLHQVSDRGGVAPVSPLRTLTSISPRQILIPSTWFTHGSPVQHTCHHEVEQLYLHLPWSSPPIPQERLLCSHSQQSCRYPRPQWCR